jgi:hypothetical protein
MSHVEKFDSDYGGTEMLQPLRASIEQRCQDMPLEVMLLTDGEIWDQKALFEYLNQSVGESKAPIRVFTLGIGNGVSHALIEGVARAGNGFSQTVGEGEKMDNKVVRMLKGALSPHLNDCTLEVRYKVSGSMSDSYEEDDTFEVIEVADCLKVKLDLDGAKDDQEKTVSRLTSSMNAFFTNYAKEPTSFSGPGANPDKDVPIISDDTGEQRYAHLPKVDIPKIIQAPQDIPPLFAFNRTTVYLLFGPDAPQATPISVVLRASSAHGPLELEIPVQILEQPGETMHQLAAKKAVSELEQSRGWLAKAKDESNTLLKTKYEGRFKDMVECEAVRLGVQFQVGGKWCSFVAVESAEPKAASQEGEVEDWEWLDYEVDDPMEADQIPDSLQSQSSVATCEGQAQKPIPPPRLSGSRSAPSRRSAVIPARPTAKRKSKLGGMQRMQASYMPASISYPVHTSSHSTSAPFGDINQDPNNFEPGLTFADDAGALENFDFDSFLHTGADVDFSNQVMGQFDFNPPTCSESDDFTKGIGTPSSFVPAGSPVVTQDRSESEEVPTVVSMPAKLLSFEDLVHYLIGLQTFSGAWVCVPSLVTTLASSLVLDEAIFLREIDAATDKKLFTTALVVVVFEERLAEWKSSWELVVEKARGWLNEEAEKDDVEKVVVKARGIVTGTVATERTE